MVSHQVNRKKLTIVGGLLLLGALWFVAVDWSYFVDDCPDCYRGKDVFQYRVFTFPVHESIKEFPSVIQQVAADLGVPCRHPNSTSWHKYRFWGLWFCKWPCINGTVRLTGDPSSYTRSDSALVAALATNDPAMVAEFSRRVLVLHEFEFVRTVLEKAGVHQAAQEDRVAE